jgi:sterol desaturase/sphingolipid hydroxylase (fatty acid hydroxylase superfamily)
MHIWHHAKELPETTKYGVNYGITLSLWDYLFKTNYIPYNGRDIALGFEGDDNFPKDFINQELYPLNRK